MTGASSGYQPRVLTIGPPPADEVLKQRITFAVRVAEGKIAPAILSGIRLRLTSIVSFLQATLRAIRDNEAIRLFLANITGRSSSESYAPRRSGPPSCPVWGISGHFAKVGRCPLFPERKHSLERQAYPLHVRDHGLVDFDPGCLDDSLPLLGILFQKPREFS